MVKSNKLEVFLILTTGLSRRVISLYKKIQRANANHGDVVLLVHAKNDKTIRTVKGVNIFSFTDDILHSMGYQPIGETLVPGNNHFPVLQFFRSFPKYDYYWCIEDDVAFSGRWSNFFKNRRFSLSYDFISSHIRSFSDMPKWFWWPTFKTPGQSWTEDEMINSFNPIYRVSNAAVKHIDDCLKIGYSGHHEVILPTLIKRAGFLMADFGAQPNSITPVLCCCTLGTMRWKPIFFTAGCIRNKLYHPVKSKITWTQVMELLRRTYRRRTNYLS